MCLGIFISLRLLWDVKKLREFISIRSIFGMLV